MGMVSDCMEMTILVELQSIMHKRRITEQFVFDPE